MPPAFGETLEIQTVGAPEEQSDSLEAPVQEPLRAPESPTEEPGVNLATAPRPSGAAHSALRPSGDAHPERELFGAVGTRFATDLPATFTHAIPQAFSADPAWTGAALGDAGAVDLTLVLDEAGHLASSSLVGHPSLALRSSVERTLSLLAARVFTARRPSTRLRLTAHVTRDDLHDGLHGDVFALSGGSFAGVIGSAFFALPAPSGTGPGRRVDVELRIVP